MPGRHAKTRRVNGQSAQTAFAMEMLRIDGGQKERPRAAGMHRHVFAPSPFTHQTRVAGSEFARHIATHGGNAEQIDGIARGEGEEQSDSVVDAGIAVVDDGGGRHGGIVQRIHGRRQQAASHSGLPTYGSEPHLWERVCSRLYKRTSKAMKSRTGMAASAPGCSKQANTRCASSARNCGRMAEASASTAEDKVCAGTALPAVDGEGATTTPHTANTSSINGPVCPWPGATREAASACASVSANRCANVASR